MNIDNLTKTEVDLLVELVAAKFAKWTNCKTFGKYRYLICEHSLGSSLRKNFLVVCNTLPPQSSSSGGTNRYDLRVAVQNEILVSLNKDPTLRIGDQPVRSDSFDYTVVYARGSVVPKTQRRRGRSGRSSGNNLLADTSTANKRMFLAAVAAQASWKVNSLYTKELIEQASLQDQTADTKVQFEKYTKALVFNASDQRSIAKVAFSVITEDILNDLRSRFSIPDDMYIRLDQPYYQGLKCTDVLINAMRDAPGDQFCTTLYDAISKYDLTSILDKLVASNEPACLRFAAIYGNSTHQALCLCGTYEPAREAAELAHNGTIEKAKALIISTHRKQAGLDQAS